MIRQWFYDISGRLQSWIVPTLKYSQALYEEELIKNCSDRKCWLDLGCGHHLLPPWRFDQEIELVRRSNFVVGIDYDFSSLKKHRTIKNRVRADIAELPFGDDTFDLITSNMVFEHLDNPETQLKEISRVLRRGGRLIFHTPKTFGYSTMMARAIPEFVKAKLVHILEGREEDDIFPTFYRINSLSRIVNVSQSTGFSIANVRMICSFPIFAILPPLAFFELLWIRFLLSKKGKWLRTNMIVILDKI